MYHAYYRRDDKPVYEFEAFSTLQEAVVFLREGRDRGELIPVSVEDDAGVTHIDNSKIGAALNE